MQFSTLLSVKEKVDGLMNIGKQISQSSLFKYGFTDLQVKEACRAILQDNEKKSVSCGVTAQFMVWTLSNLNLALARIPFMHKLVEEQLKMFPDTTRDIVLQKEMVISSLKMTDIRMAFASGESKKIQDMSLSLVRRCKSVIDTHLDHALIKKSHEIDPFLKVAWVVKESRGMVNETIFKSMLVMALNYCRILSGERMRIGNCVEMISSLNFELENIRLQYDM